MATTRVIDRMRVIQGWGRSYNAVVWDRCLALVLTGLAFVPAMSAMSAEFGDLPRRHADALSLVLVLAQTTPVAVRSRRPLACLAIVGGSFAVYEVLAYPPEFGTVTLYLALYSAGAHQERFRRSTAVAATAAYAVATAVLYALGSPDGLTDHLVYFLMLAACWVLGAFVRQRRAEEAERRRLAADAATAAERTRIARDLHDVVTHHVTSMVVQADAAQFLAESPDRVVTAVTAIAGTGRRALAELRHLLGVLEATGESAGSRTLVGGTVRDLVEQTREGGQPVELIEDGDRPTLPAAAGLAVYRVVQEGLTNAVKHAAGQRTTVRVRYSPASVEVEVTSTTAPVRPAAAAGWEPSGGRGLNGLRERVRALGGELTAGERQDGRFRLLAMIPIGSDT